MAGSDVVDAGVVVADVVDVAVDEADPVAEVAEPASEPTPPPAEPAQPARSGPGFFPLLLGGLVAGGIGFGAGTYLDLFGAGADGADMSAALADQAAQIAALTDQTTALETQIANQAPPEVDLSGIEAQLTVLATQMTDAAGNMAVLGDRVDAVEARPIFSGDAAADEAALTAAIDQLRADLMSQQEENTVMAEDIAAMAEAAQASIAEAEARAETAASTATAQAALSELRIAIASGAPFAGPLAEVSDAYGVEVPEDVQAAADGGVPTLAEIEASFPAAARAALPVALQSAAGDTAGDRLGAFLRSQIGGRSLEPQEGDSPDAVLSRASAAVASGDLTTALSELDALPAPAQEVLAEWRALAGERLSTLAALDDLSAALGN